MPKRIIDLQWPSAGLDRKHGFQKTAPFTTPSCQNVWGTNVADRRSTGGSRAGTGKVYAEQLGSGAKVNLLSSVDYVGTGYGGNGDDFNQSLNLADTALDTALWSTPAFYANDGILQKSDGYAKINLLNGLSTDQRGAIYKAVTIDTSSTYYVEIDTLFRGVGPVIYRLYARMNAGSPNAQSSGVIAELVMDKVDSVTFTATGSLIVNGSTVSSFSGGTFSSSSGVFSLGINGNTVTATYQGVAQLGAGVVIASHGSDTRTGFGMEVGTSATVYLIKTALVNWFRIRSNNATSNGVRTIVVAASNGQLYYDANNVMTAVGSAVLNTTELLQAAHHNQKLYIANHSTTGTDVAKVFDPSALTVSTLTATHGTAPTNCKLICRYTDRIVLAGDVSNPHLWYMSRKGDPLDWDYTQLALGDNGSAISGQDSDAGEIGAPMTAIAPFGDDYMVMAASDSLFVMRGDPAFGGQIDSISRRVGVIDKFAWAYTPEGHFLFLSKDGLYVLPAGAAGQPESISREKLPNELLNVDTTRYDVCMAYDVEFRGVWIMLSNKTAGSTISYFFDWEDKAFWPMAYPVTQEVCQAYFVATPFVRGVLLGCKDGYLRRHGVNYANDDGTAITSFCELGPIRLAGSEYDEGLLTELIGTVHYSLGGTVTWTARAAKNAQALFNGVSGNVDTRTGTWTPGSRGDGLNVKDRQRIRGGALTLKVADTGGNPWALETVLMSLKVSGKQRVVS